MFTHNYQPKSTDFNYAPSAVFAIYHGVDASQTFSTARYEAIKGALSDFTDKTRMNSDFTIIEVWGNGDVVGMHDALEKAFPHGVTISLLAN